VKPLNKWGEFETPFRTGSAVEVKPAAMRVSATGNADGLGEPAHVVSHLRLRDDPTPVARGVVSKLHGSGELSDGPEVALLPSEQAPGRRPIRGPSRGIGG
jgi:hypothetical protein